MEFTAGALASLCGRAHERRQFSAGVEHARLHRRLADAHNLCGLLDRASVIVNEVKNFPMLRHSQVAIKLEPLTRRSGSQPEFTGHPLSEMRLRHHFGSIELQLALARE